MQKKLIQNLRIIEKITKEEKKKTLTKKLNKLPFHTELSKFD